MHKMRLYIIPIIVGLFCGFLTAFLWALLWTLVIPWPAHEIFYTIVFVLGGWGAAMWTRRGMPH